MKKVIVSIYGMAILGALVLQSCEDGPIVPNGGGNNNVDTTWVDDSLDNSGAGNNPIDSTDWNGGGIDPNDSTNWNGGGEPIDSTDWNGNGNPGDSLGGN